MESSIGHLERKSRNLLTSGWHIICIVVRQTIYFIQFMIQAFVKENDDNGLLNQVEPTVPALIRYIQRE
ncbi:MAG: hypothetical protein ABI688_09310 [Bacteroidota bacterium]